MDHDHDMGGMSPTTTMSMGAESTGAADDMDMGMGGGCKISMLINYNTVGACFISDDWQITSTGMFAGSCIGVVLLCVLLEFLRRSVKELDRSLLKQHYASHASASAAAPANGAENSSKDAACVVSYPPFRPNIWQQALRAMLHTAQFTVAYFIMLLGKTIPSLPRGTLPLTHS
jgi:solute carrier family 31 (copper transporter), member 1